MKSKRIILILIFILSAFFTLKLSAQEKDILSDNSFSPNNISIIQKIDLPGGRIIEAMHTPGPPTPPPGYERKRVLLDKSNRIAAVVTLSGVPAFEWSFGCSATSAAMIAGYYDRHGFSTMYSGPTNGGIMPLDNSVWPTWVDSSHATRSQCPLSATHNGLDGRLTNGHVDDYWVSYLSGAPDPFISNWTEHTYGECTGDYMKTNQYNYDNVDGSTTFYNFTNGSPLSWEDMEYYNIHEIDGGYGLKLFYQSRGYTVSDMYNQYIYGWEGNTLGFTFDQYMNEIDAGRPVMIHVVGHTMVGIGYNDITGEIYLHDTWDYSVHSMDWGGSYAGMQQNGVTIVILQTPQIIVTNGADESLNYPQSGPYPPQTDWPFGQFSLTCDGAGPTVNTVTIHLSGYYSGLEGTHPFRLFASSSNDFLSASAIGSNELSSGGSVTFSSLHDELPSGVRYYWVTADLSETAGGTINGTLLNSTDLDITSGTIMGASTYGLLNSGEDVSLPVELSSFSAYGQDGQILLTWTTQSELNNLGFIVTRSTTYDGTFDEIASYQEQKCLIGRGNTADSTNYRYCDKDVVSNHSYYYKLTNVDFGGQRTTYGPVYCSPSLKDEHVLRDDGYPVTFTLHQNYPNPFNPRTIIEYELPNTDYVELAIYNLMGQKVATLVSEINKAGYYRAEWDATEISGGVYFYRIQIGHFIQVKKMIVLK